MHEGSSELGRVLWRDKVEERARRDFMFLSLERGQPAVHPMCVKGFCFLTVLCGLAASGETPVRCEWIHRVRR